MDEIPLKEFLERPGNTQASVAASVGVTQGAIYQMLKAGRSIFVVEQRDGSIELFERKPLGARVGAARR